MRKTILIVGGVAAIAGCASPVTYEPPKVHHQFAKDSNARMNEAMSAYYACLHEAVKKYRTDAAPADIADAGLALCDRHARDYERHSVSYSVALRVGHPNELVHGEAMGCRLYADMVKRGRGFVLNQALLGSDPLSRSNEQARKQ